MKNQKTISTLWGIIIIVAVAVVLFGGCFAYQYFAKQDFETISDKNSSWKTYTNTEYGFEVKLPDSWKGYTVEKQQWTGWAVSGNDIKYFGVKIIIKNPNTTQEQVWQDIPILLFSKDQWKLVTDEELAVSAAPIGPEKIGENSSYVFATPPRWYGFTDAQGWQEAVEIVKTFKAF
jgi:hypothetical protein